MVESKVIEVVYNGIKMWGTKEGLHVFFKMNFLYYTVM
jgi:hypothetical protein